MKASIKAAYREILAVDNETPRVPDFVRRVSVEISRHLVIDTRCPARYLHLRASG